MNMSKIIVEDRTKEPTNEEKVGALRTNIFLSTYKIGTMMGLNSQEIASAMFASAEDMAFYMQSVELNSALEVFNLRKKALKDAAEKYKRLKENYVLNSIVKSYHEAKSQGEGEGNG